MTHYFPDESVKFEVGDIVVTRDYDSKVVEVVSFVGNEIIVLLKVSGGVIGQLERATKLKKLLEEYPRIIHRRDKIMYADFLAESDK